MAGAGEIPQTLIHFSEESDGAVMVGDSVIFPLAIWRNLFSL